MAPRPQRLERITNLFLALLETNRPLPLREIGSAVAGYPTSHDALRQAFERDKRTLREGGIPIAVEPLDGDDQFGYRILPEDYYLPDLGLESDEQQALAFALASVRLEGGVTPGVAAKLGAVAPESIPTVAVLPATPALGLLGEAIRRRSPASFDYHGRGRTVECHRLVFRSGSWYLIGLDRSVAPEGERRTFRVDRIESGPELGEAGAYEPDNELDVSKELSFSMFSAPGTDRAPGATEVVVEVDAPDAEAAVSLVGPSGHVDRHPDGSVRLRFEVGDERAFLAWVLGLGDAAEVVAPEHLRAAAADRLTAAARGGDRAELATRGER